MADSEYELDVQYPKTSYLWLIRILVLLFTLSLIVVVISSSASIAPLGNIWNVNLVDSFGDGKTHETQDVILPPVSEQPNFVFILADDMGWNSIGYEDYYLSFVSPVITDLASNGVVISSYYAQEVCTPSRAAFLTGRYPLSIGK